mmetsp:Transcript_14713/g.25038  ORF Transcript_14713/g.25038 Transcript_14713/m.25038 type:complete len:115 (-) Transcript_14713:69-413(-)
MSLLLLSSLPLCYLTKSLCIPLLFFLSGRFLLLSNLKLQLWSSQEGFSGLQSQWQRLSHQNEQKLGLLRQVMTKRDMEFEDARSDQLAWLQELDRQLGMEIGEVEELESKRREF